MWQLQTKTEMRSCFDSNDCTYAAVGKGLKRVTPILMPPFQEERRVCASSGRTLNICSRMKTCHLALLARDVSSPLTE